MWHLIEGGVYFFHHIMLGWPFPRRLKTNWERMNEEDEDELEENETILDDC